MELYEFVGWVLGVVGLLYMVSFWGSALWKGIYSYLNDGDSEVGDLCEWLEDSCYPDGIDYVVLGIFAPALYVYSAIGLQDLTKATGLFVPIALGTILLVYLSLHILRGVIRLNKKLDKHSEDKNAHK